MTSKVRNAATLITCCKIADKKPVNYNVILLKRGKNMKVASSQHVFPGGAFDKSDESLKWLDVFKKTEDEQKSYFSNLIFSNVNRPKLFLHENYDLNKQLLPEVSFRLCAIRETFEETGLLIASKNQSNNGKQFANFILDKNLVNKWRQKISENSNEFLKMFLELDIVPDIFGLHEWSNWLTPKHEKTLFDTMFFTCFLNEKPNTTCFDINLDESQILEFYEPKEALQNYNEDKIAFFPPQIYELSRLSRFNLIEEAAEFSLSRQSKGGIRTFQPKFVNIKDKALGLLPGDDYYNLQEHELSNTTNEQFHVVLNKNRFERNKIIDSNRIKFKIESNMLSSEKH